MDKKLAGDLSTLLGMKTHAGYSAKAVTVSNAKASGRAMAHLIEAIKGI